MGNIEYKIADGVALLTVNRPESMNALNSETIDEIKTFVKRISEDDDVGCCVITGAGEKAFIAGADVAQMYPMDREEISEYCKNANGLFRFMQESSVIFIAAINGYALGGGNELAMACDLRIASAAAVFGQPEIHLGIIPGFGGTQRLPALIGLSNAMSLMLLGNRINATEALKYGLVSEVVESEVLIEHSLKLASQICQKSRCATAGIKSAVYEGFYKSSYEGITAETGFISDCFCTEERLRLMNIMLGDKN